MISNIIKTPNTKKLVISIIESIYLFYMFRIFETSVDFNVFAAPSNFWFKHLVGNEKGLRICLFGQIAILPAIGILLLRNFIYIPTLVIKSLIVISMILSLMNFNAVAYLIPVWLIEYYLSLCIF